MKIDFPSKSTGHKEYEMRFSIPKTKIKNIALFFALAGFLTLAVWQVFFTNDKTETTFTPTDLETELSLLLKEMDGVGDVDVMIYETEEGVESVVVVCEGANNLLVNMHIREAVAAALGTNEKSVKIYLKK